MTTKFFYANLDKMVDGFGRFVGASLKVSIRDDQVAH